MKFIPLFLLVSVSLVGCSIENGSNSPTALNDVSVDLFDFSIPSVVADTKSSLAASGNNLLFLWNENDQIGIYPLEGSPVHFKLKNGAGTNSAKFDGSGWKFKTGMSYMAFSPFKMDYILNDNPYQAIPFSYKGQVQKGNNDAGHLGGYDFLAATQTISPEQKALNFSFAHLSSFMKLSIQLPGSGCYNRLSVIPLSSSIPAGVCYNLMNSNCINYKEESAQNLDLQDIETDNDDEIICLYSALAPKDYSNDRLAFIVQNESSLYSTTADGLNQESGKMTLFDEKLSKYVVDETSGISVVKMRINVLDDFDIPNGEVSGIDKIDDGTYAVVDNNLLGGGISYLSVSIDENTLSLNSAIKTMAPGTASASGGHRDPEGVAYNGTSLFSAGENQTILEYSLEGYPTGRSLHVPSDMSSDKVQGNKGFESLSYNPETKRYWTATETSLKKDIGLFGTKPLVRIQSFDGTSLDPAERFLYLMDQQEDLNSVYGIPDLLALDDGRLIVMERERILVEGIIGSWCKCRLYLINPTNDNGAILSKHLITELQTGIPSDYENTFANYEGICFGPNLPNGHRTIILVNDSSRGAVTGGTKQRDYLTVLEVEGI